MTARRHALVAIVAAALAVLLWWLARDLVVADLPDHEAFTGGDPAAGVTRTVVDPRWLFGACVAAGISMVATTLAVLRAGASRGR